VSERGPMHRIRFYYINSFVRKTFFWLIFKFIANFRPNYW
jgi:hypothetical protein